MMKQKALLFGSSGLVGGHLLEMLLQDERFTEVVVFNRRTNGMKHPKLKEIITDFSASSSWVHHVRGDVLFCSIGTTIKKAGSQEVFRSIDLDLPLVIARACADNGIRKMIVVSSLGADADSGNFYLKTKGEMEKGILRLNIPEVHFLRPSMLLGDRKESRPMETAGKLLMKWLGFIFVGKLKRYRAVEAVQVASVMIGAATKTGMPVFIESEMIQ